MYVVFAVAVVLIVVLLLLLDRVLKAVRQGHRRRDAAIRLTAAAASAQAQARRQAAVADARDALTTVLPAIQKEERGPRHVA